MNVNYLLSGLEVVGAAFFGAVFLGAAFPGTAFTGVLATGWGDFRAALAPFNASLRAFSAPFLASRISPSLDAVAWASAVFFSTAATAAVTALRSRPSVLCLAIQPWAASRNVTLVFGLD